MTNKNKCQMTNKQIETKNETKKTMIIQNKAKN